MVKDVLKLLLEGEAVRTEAMASVLGVSEAEIEATLAKLEDEKMLLGWRPVINPKALAEHEVQALIEVSIVPEREGGFNRIAQRIARFDQVVTCYLMSGGYDLLVVIRGKNLLEIATFVSEKLATLGPVQSTATRFMLQCYKIDGFMIDGGPEETDRLPVSP
jgi:DNA-binding Lrp family transcriptional regulator